MGDTDVEQDQPGGRVVDYDVPDRQPQEQLLLGESFQTLEPPVREVGPDDTVEVDPGLELGQARPVQEHLKEAIRAEAE